MPHRHPIFLGTALCLVTVLATRTVALQSPSQNVLDYGVVADGVAVNTQAIQSAVDACSSRGGGVVFFPAGKYLTGTVFLKNHVTLELDSGAVILGSTRLEDYPLTLCSFASYTDRYCGRALFWADGVEDIGIIGRGTIDGQGAAFKDNRPSDEEADKIAADWTDPGRYRPRGVYVNRPYMIRFISCKKVRIEGITLRDSPMWMQHYLNCDFVRISGITVYNHCSSNNDMVDIDCCRDVLISDCYGDSDDDALTLKSTADVPTENVTVTNCVLSSHCNAIKMGTESSGGFKNITISNCVVRPSRDPKALAGRDEGLAGIALEIVDGGTLDRVTISNIAIEGEATPLFVRLGNRARTFRKEIAPPAVGTLRNVILSDIVATDGGAIGCSITGLPGHPVENITLSNIKLSFKGGVTEPPSGEVPELPEKYPEGQMFGTLPAYGFYCRHIKGLTLRDIDLQFEQTDVRPALVFEDVHQLRLEGLSAKIDSGATSQIQFKQVFDALIGGCRPGESETFLRLLQPCGHITAIGNDFSRVATPFTFEDPSLERELQSEANRLK